MVYRTGLENRQARKGLGSSNLPLSANRNSVSWIRLTVSWILYGIQDQYSEMNFLV